MLLTCRGYYPRTCRYFSCRQTFLPGIHQRCSNHLNTSLRLRSASNVDQTVLFALTFVDFAYTGKLEIQIRRLTIMRKRGSNENRQYPRWLYAFVSFQDTYG